MVIVEVGQVAFEWLQPTLAKMRQKNKSLDFLITQMKEIRFFKNSNVEIYNNACILAGRGIGILLMP